jgi:hypothetical protein
MKLKAVDIMPDPADPLVMITGRNAQGKTAVLTCLRMLFGGRAADPSEVIRRGEEEARVVGETEDFIVKIRWKGGNRSLTVESKDGSVFKSPQAMLDKIKGDLTFDPLAFSRMKPKDQKDLLLRLVGLEAELERIDREKDALTTKRRDIGRDRDAADGALKSLPPVYPGTLKEEVNVSELMGKLSEARKHRETHATAVQTKVRTQESIATYRESIRVAEETIADAKRRIAILEEAISTWDEQIQQELLASNSLETLEAQVANADAVNRAVRNRKAKEEAESKYNRLALEYDEHTKALKEKDAEKERLIREAPFPVQGLSFDGAGVSFNGIPLEQCSSAEQLRVSLAVGMALKPLLKVLLIQDGSLLDSASMGVIREMAEANKYQVWVEAVDESGKVGIVIEDGEVVG